MPLPENLTPDLLDRWFRLDGPSLFVRIPDGDMVPASRPCDLVANGSVSLQLGTEGLWIPYRAQVATYGFFGDAPWAASGPFSGCELAIGQRGDDIYLAHISIERGRPEARHGFAQWIRRSPAPHYRSRITASQQRGNYACYVFASIDPVLELVRMDVATTAIGGTDGTIMNIEYINLDDQYPAPRTPSPAHAEAPPSGTSRGSRRRASGRGSRSHRRCVIL